MILGLCEFAKACYREDENTKRGTVKVHFSLFFYPMIHNCVPSAPSLHFMLSQTNAINIFTNYSLIFWSSKLCLDLPRGVFLPVLPSSFFLLKCCINFSSLSCVLHVQSHILQFSRSCSSPLSWVQIPLHHLFVTIRPTPVKDLRFSDCRLRYMTPCSPLKVLLATSFCGQYHGLYETCTGQTHL
jgi:hypothetical protein